jgi:prepilin-type N-terminal cleavage/methylation domain-containing protein
MRKTKGFSLIELLIVVAIILVIAAIAIPNLLRSRMQANQSAAAATLRNIHNSQAVYSTNFGAAVGFANTLQKLGPGTPCDQTHACLVDNVLGCAAEPCLKSGYQYYLTSTAGSEPFFDYAGTATPFSWANSGAQNYCAFDDGTVRQQVNPAGKLAAAVTRPGCADPTGYVAIGN